MKPLLILCAVQTLLLLLVCHELNTANNANTASAARQQALLQTLPAAIAQAHLAAQAAEASRNSEARAREFLRTLPPPTTADEARVKEALEASLK